MISFTLSEILDIVGGELCNGYHYDQSFLIKSVSTDTRSLKSGDLFVPLKGGNFDGHDFLNKALEKGAAAYLTEDTEKRVLSSAPGIRVKDSLEALQKIAARVRERLSAKVVAITGSSGKTCTKEMLASILQQEFSIVASPSNYNNEVGVPLTILRADAETEVIVVEMAMRGIGQISELAKIARPEIGIITNVGQAHLEFLGSQEKIAQAKGELLEALPAEGIAFLNKDDLWTESLAKLTSARVITYGLSEKADVFAGDVVLNSEAKASFILSLFGDKVPIEVNVPGRHSVYNALAAIAVARYLGVSVASLRAGLASVSLGKMRLEVLTTPSGIAVVNDAYNANPTSMEASLNTIAAMATSGRRIALLGDMAELGRVSKEAHYKLGEQAASFLDFLILIGSEVTYTAEGALQAGLSKDKVKVFSDKGDAAKFLLDLLRPGDLVLLKASRIMALEEIVSFIREV